MQYRPLGQTGLKVSELCLGTMTFGSNFYNIGKLDQAASTELVTKAIDYGINFFDTANVYSYGESETLLGQALKSTGLRRDAYVVATKVFGSMDPEPKGRVGEFTNRGSSRHHIMASCEASLKRLGTDYIDLYQLHGWDQNTPLEETMSVLDDLVRQGKVRYLGCSNWAARQLAKALALAAANRVERFATLQAYYALAGRDLEHELLPLCVEEHVGVLPWSPLAGGFLSGKYRRNTAAPADARRANFDFPPVDTERGYDAIELMHKMASEKGCTVAQIALAWLLHRPAVASVIIGASKVSQLDDNVKSSGVTLTTAEMAALAKTTEPKTLYPQWMIERQNLPPTIKKS